MTETVSENLKVQDLAVDGIEYERLLSVAITEKAGAHGVCKLTLRIPMDADPPDLLKLNDRMIKLQIAADKTILFCGVLMYSALEQHQDRVFLHLSVYSLSKRMDIKRKTRTFQNPKKKLDDVLQTIAKEYSSGEIKVELQAEDPSQTIDRMLYQHNETDWELLLRLAGDQGKLLFTDAHTYILRLSVGFKSFKKQEDKSGLYSTQMLSLLQCERIKENTDDKARSCYYLDTSYVQYDLGIGVGQSSSYDGKEQVVIESRVMQEGEDSSLSVWVKLRNNEGCRRSAWAELADWTVGHWLEATILDVKGTDVMVQFSCDKEQKKEEAMPIPYESTASNYLYVMPDIGDPVRVYFATYGAVSAVGGYKMPSGKDGGKSADTSQEEQKPENRSLTTQGNMLEFEPDGVSLMVSKKEKESIAQLDSKGITLQAKKDVILNSKGDMYYQAAQGKAMDNQVSLLTAYLANFGMYVGVGGQPPSSAPASPEGMLGQTPSELKSAGAKLEKGERSDLAKAWDKLLKDQKKEDKQEDKKEGSAGSGGKLCMKANKGFVLKVGDSSIAMDGGDVEIKTRTLFQVGTGMAGVPLGTLSSFAGGSPKSRSAESMNPAHGAQDRKRSTEGGEKTYDSKKISRGV